MAVTSAEVGIVRARSGLFIGAQGASKRWLVLDQERAQYLAVPQEAGMFLLWLSTRPLGATEVEITTRYPSIDIDKLSQLRLVEIVPALGRAVKKRLVAEFYLLNIFASVWFRFSGWRAVRHFMRSGACDYPQPTTARPLIFDEIETAAQLAFCCPGTNRLCTIVAITCMLMLRRRWIEGEIVIMADVDQPDPHAFIVSKDHRIDPSPEQISGSILGSMERVAASIGIPPN